jgi:hypothetical protein
MNKQHTRQPLRVFSLVGGVENDNLKRVEKDMFEGVCTTAVQMEGPQRPLDNEPGAHFLAAGTFRVAKGASHASLKIKLVRRGVSRNGCVCLASSP